MEPAAPANDAATPRIAIGMPETGTAEAIFSLWYVHPGETVYEGDRVAEVLIPGATVDVLAPADGVLAAADAQPGDRLTPGAVLGWLEPSPA